MNESDVKKLPGNVKPLRYAIDLAPDLDAFTFEGAVSIEIEVLEATERITLNAAELEIASVVATLADGRSVEASIETDEEEETAVFSFGETLPAGRASLACVFTGVLNDQLRGFYRSEYVDKDGEKRYMATTQFEATDARRAFPCWDEPSLKATFEVTLKAPKELTTLSNMPVAMESVEGPLKTVRFQETPKMSTYLLAFVVGDLASVEATGPGGTLVRVFTTRGKEEQGRFALENSVKLLGYFNDYFGIPYPLPKMDHVAVPDFAAGAMENWGCIIYRETALLFEEGNSASAARQRIMQVVSHEMAHMWFGDLVTMEWWDDLWLNESFASWMGDKGVDVLFPEWRMWTQFVSQDTNAALSLDGLESSHPIEVPVKDPAEIREIFDAISYSKGGSVLRMLEQYLGADTFRGGLRAYIDEHQYANARTAHLWNALEAASGEPVTRIMNSWTQQMGYPVVDVKTEHSDDGTRVGLSQRRFLYSHLLGGGKDDSSLWETPVLALTPGGELQTSLLSAREGEIDVPAGDGWIKVNAGQTGFYRVNYEAEDWERLCGAVADKAFSASDRLGVQNDAYALMRAGIAPATHFLNAAGAYAGEDDATVWGDLASNLRGFETLLADEPSLAAYRRFAGGLFERIAGEVGWDAGPGEGHLESLRRSTVLGQRGYYGDPTLADEARGRFERYLHDEPSLHPDVRAVVFSLAAQYGGREAYDQLWKLVKAATLSEEKMRLLGALTRFEDEALLAETLERSLTDEVRIQDAVLVIVSLAGNLKGRDLAWEFIKSNWGELDRRYGAGGFAIARLVSVGGGFTTAARHDDVRDFFGSNPAPSAARAVRQTLERIELNARWLELNRGETAAWLSERG